MTWMRRSGRRSVPQPVPQPVPGEPAAPTDRASEEEHAVGMIGVVKAIVKPNRAALMRVAADRTRPRGVREAAAHASEIAARDL